MDPIANKVSAGADLLRETSPAATPSQDSKAAAVGESFGKAMSNLEREIAEKEKEVKQLQQQLQQEEQNRKSFNEVVDFITGSDGGAGNAASKSAASERTASHPSKAEDDWKIRRLEG